MLKKSFSRRVILGLVFALVLVFLLYFQIYHAGYNMLTEELSLSLYTRASFMADNLEEEIKRIQRLQYECINDDILYYSIGAFPVMTKSEKVKKLLDIQDRLKILNDSSLYIDEVFVYIPKLNRKISSVKGVELLGESRDEIAAFQKGIERTVLFYMDGNIYMGVSYPYNTTNQDSSHIFTLILRLSEATLRRELSSLNEYSESGVALTDCNGQYALTAGRDISQEYFNIEEKQRLFQITDREDGQQYTVQKINSSYLDMDLFAYVSNKTVSRNLYIYRNIFLVCLFTVIAMMAFYVYSLHATIDRPIKTLVENLERMEKGKLGVRIGEKREDEFGYVYLAFNKMAESLQNQMEINYRQKMLTQQAELRHLQSQINPHFLYNSFFTLYRMAKDEDCESMVELSSYLSEYYRYITKSAQSDVELKLDVEHARRYAQIQAIRFRRRLTVEFEELPAEYEKILVPRLILHPLLENAFEHGLSNVEKGGVVRIWYERQGERLVINVQDNGSGMTREELRELRESFLYTGEMIEDGLCNINRRLKIKFGDEFGLEISSEQGQGTTSSLILPADGKEKDRSYVQSTDSR